jgi:hypothetical protein
MHSFLQRDTCTILAAIVLHVELGYGGFTKWIVAGTVQADLALSEPASHGWFRFLALAQLAKDAQQVG